MREAQLSPDPSQRARWWMYRSSTTTPAEPDAERVAAKNEHVDDFVLALPAPVNATYWDRQGPSVLFGPDDDSDDESSDEEVPEVVVLSDDEPEVQMVAPGGAAVQGGRSVPIEVDDLPDLPESAIIKQEVEEEEVAPAVQEVSKKKKAAVKRAAVLEVRRSERLKLLKD